MKKSSVIFSLSNELPQLFAVLIAFFIPFYPKIVPVAIVLMLVSGIIKYKKLKLNKEYLIFSGLFILFYLCYVFGMLISDNKSEGLFDLEVKLSFLVIPLFFLFHGPVDVRYIRAIFTFYIMGCILASFTCLYFGFQCYFDSGDLNCFFSSFITKVIHSTYLAVYFCFAILILINYFINYYSRMKFLQRILILFLALYFSVFVLLISSKGGIIALALVTIVSVVYYFYKAGKVKNVLLILSVLSVFFLVLFSFSSYVRERFKNAFVTYQLSEEELFSIHHDSTESTAVRLMIWTVARELIAENPFGSGTGDNKDVLLEKYKSRNMNGAYVMKLNCHNQYLETGISVGYHGLLSLMALILFGFYHAITKRNFLLIWIIAIVALNLFFESFLERQAGIVFFVFFTWVLYTSVPEIIPFKTENKNPS